eukprot:1201313-Amphidinium_carterae.1
MCQPDCAGFAREAWNTRDVSRTRANAPRRRTHTFRHSVQDVIATSTSASCWVGRPPVLGTVAQNSPSLPEVRARQWCKSVLGQPAHACA